MTTEARVVLKEKEKPMGLCALCSSPAVEIDHIPISRGGSNEPENLQALCKDCNCEKSDKLTGITLPPFKKGTRTRGCGRPFHLPYRMDSLRSEFNVDMQKMLYSERVCGGFPLFAQSAPMSPGTNSRYFVQRFRYWGWTAINSTPPACTRTSIPGCGSVCLTVWSPLIGPPT